MKFFLLFTCLLVMSCSGCSKQDKGCITVDPDLEEPQILTYIAADSIKAVKDDSSGIYYQVIEPGAGVTPTTKSTVSVTYVGKLLNGTIFDQRTSSFTLTNVIEGWQIGIPLIKKGGRIKLIIPSAYAYGCNGNGPTIPSNSVLYFDISLLDVQ